MTEETCVLCSACLLGLPCRYDGASKPNAKVLAFAEQNTVIPICPEQLGGLPTPREGAERVGDRVMTRSGQDCTEQFKKGAELVLRIAKICGAKRAILKQRSPSCGCGKIYDGSFSGTSVTGNGMTAELLMKEGLQVISEEEL